MKILRGMAMSESRFEPLGVLIRVTIAVHTQKRFVSYFVCDV
jgi:hypothetical protein